MIHPLAFFASAVRLTWHFVVLSLIPFGTAASFIESKCEEVRRGLHTVAAAGIVVFSDGLPTGAANDEDRDKHVGHFQRAISEVAKLLVLIQRDGTDYREECRPKGFAAGVAGDLSLSIFELLLQRSAATLEMLNAGTSYGADLYGLFGRQGPRWSDVLHSGWPIFRLAAVLAHKIQANTGATLGAVQLLEPRSKEEQCSDAQEDFHDFSVLLAHEGRTVRIHDVLEFVRDSLRGGSNIFNALYGEALVVEGCPISLSVALAALADAMQCSWQRPRAHQSHDLLNVLVNRAQELMLDSFSGGGFRAAILSRWPLVSLLSRLDPPFPSASPADGTAPATLVSWTSREAELGGLNWAARFAQHVFGEKAGVALQEDVECADVYVFRSKLPINFGGVLLFVDGERSPADSMYDKVLADYPASIVVSPIGIGGTSSHFAVPYASTSFASRELLVPSMLEVPWHARRLIAPQQAIPHAQRRFAAYLAFKCWGHRERFFNVLNSASMAAGLGGVDALSRCGNSSMSEDQRKSKRYARSYIDDAALMYSNYKFAMVFENRLSKRYVTEKIVNAFAGGAIPVYWGSPFVLQIFSPKSFIYVNAFSSFETAAQHVVRIAKDRNAYASMVEEAPLKNTTEARWLFSWHRGSSALEGPLLRDEIARVALEKAEQSNLGKVPPSERRPWAYAHLFSGLS